jgi:beta-lactamase regulating signal transducer with metallopeptidase domain
MRMSRGFGDLVPTAVPFGIPLNAFTGMAGLGQTTTSASSVLTSIQSQISSIWTDLQATKIAGIGLGVIIVGGVVAMHFMKKR